MLTPSPMGTQTGYHRTVRSHCQGQFLLQGGIVELTMIAQDTETGLWIRPNSMAALHDLISGRSQDHARHLPDRFGVPVSRSGVRLLRDAFYCHVAEAAWFKSRASRSSPSEFADTG